MKTVALAILLGCGTELAAAFATFTNTKISHIAGLSHWPSAELINLIAGRMAAQGDSIAFGRLFALFMIQWALWAVILYILLKLATLNKKKES